MGQTGELILIVNYKKYILAAWEIDSWDRTGVVLAGGLQHTCYCASPDSFKSKLARIAYGQKHAWIKQVHCDRKV